MDGRHLGREDGVRLPHLSSEDRPLRAGCRATGTTGPPRFERRLEGAQADARCTEVRLLVDLDQRGMPAAGLEDLLHLVARDRVQPAAEGGELHEGQPRRSAASEARGGIEPGVVGPLVDDAQGPVDLPEVRDGVLREDGHPEGDRELRRCHG